MSRDVTVQTSDDAVFAGVESDISRETLRCRCTNEVFGRAAHALEEVTVIWIDRRARREKSGRMEQMFLPFIVLILMGDWCGGVYTVTRE